MALLLPKQPVCVEKTEGSITPLSAPMTGRGRLCPSPAFQREMGMERFSLHTHFIYRKLKLSPTSSETLFRRQDSSSIESEISPISRISSETSFPTRNGYGTFFAPYPFHLQKIETLPHFLRNAFPPSRFQFHRVRNLPHFSHFFRNALRRSEGRLCQGGNFPIFPYFLRSAFPPSKFQFHRVRNLPHFSHFFRNSLRRSEGRLCQGGNLPIFPYFLRSALQRSEFRLRSVGNLPCFPCLF